MTWSIINENGVELLSVFSFQIEQHKGKPATLVWTMPFNNEHPAETITVYRGEEVIFYGRVYERPTAIEDDVATWIAVAMGTDFQLFQGALTHQLTEGAILSGNIKDCVGANPGYFHIDRVTHKVSWIPLEHPSNLWDSEGLHEKDSVHITPIDIPLTGITASVKLTNLRQESGMMDVGPYLTTCFGDGIETYSGKALEAQWDRLLFKAFRAGYEVLSTDLISLPHQRADLAKALSCVDDKGHVVSLPYHTYKVRLLLGWAMPVTTHTTLNVSTGQPGEMISLAVKDVQSMDESALLEEIPRWMKAYAIVRSFSTQVKARVLITSEVSLTTLDTNAWGRIKDPRFHAEPMEGPIVSYVIKNDGGTTWADITLLWAAEPSLEIESIPTLKQRVKGTTLNGPRSPQEIIAWATPKYTATEQYAYYTEHAEKTFEEIMADFPVTQLEIGLHPVLNSSAEYLEKEYSV